MTYSEFCDIVYRTDHEEDYYCYCCANTPKTNPRFKEVESKYNYFRRKNKKIHDFKKRVLTDAIKNLPKNFFDIS